jgi:hypothetical protein
MQQRMRTTCQITGAQQQQHHHQWDHQPLCQLLQHQPLEQMAPMATASHVMPQQRLDLLQNFSTQHNRRRLEGAAAAGVVVPRSKLEFSQLLLFFTICMVLGSALPIGVSNLGAHSSTPVAMFGAAKMAS